ncbi:MAG: outer membrane protein assembly factor BamD [Deltaproteobacteria bacterium]|nr:outer membrane protein assembly factor BamD [Deltaproteobacteria bacterium]
MRRQSNRFTMIFLLMLSFFIFLNGCSTINRLLSGEEEEVDVEELMTDGMSQLERGSYTAAIETFTKVKDRYPYSKFAITAEMKVADALYQTEEYDRAQEAYDEFEKLHPKHKEIPYIIYQKGMCQFMQMTTKDREQVHTVKAKEEFERLISRFPKDVYADRARKNLRKCLIFLAEHEIHVGHFYFKKGFYRAALARYTYALENYPDLGHYSEALEYISQCKEKLATEKGLEEAKKSRWPFSIWR